MRSHASGRTTLDVVDLLDRIIDSGVVGIGDVLLSVAEIDLVHLELRLALNSIDEQSDHPVGVDTRHEQSTAARTSMPRGSPPRAPETRSRPTPRERNRPATKRDPQSHHSQRPDDVPQEVQRGLAALVLTLVDILRELMERQAVRRLETGSLADHEVERLGQTFLAMRQRMEELKEAFGVRSTHHDAAV